ncbi:MAG TPA: hypothetical protein PLU23_07060, partial [Anaerolineaceae bacterium]|nr:hypothetical protein [Anaerolineaceae bacterium]
RVKFISCRRPAVQIHLLVLLRRGRLSEHFSYLVPVSSPRTSPLPKPPIFPVSRPWKTPPTVRGGVAPKRFNPID